MEPQDEYYKMHSLLSEFVDKTIGQKQAELKRKFMSYEFVGRTLQEVCDDFKDLQEYNEKEQAARVIQFMLTMTYTPPSFPVAIYRLENQEDTTGVRIVEGSSLSVCLKEHPELKDFIIAGTNEYFGVQVLRVRDPKEV